MTLVPQQVGLAQKQCQDIQHMIDITRYVDKLSLIITTFSPVPPSLPR